MLDKHISTDTMLQTDRHPTYAIISERKWVGRHGVIDHNRSYAMGDIHTNTIENSFSLLKGGAYGTFHKVSIKHLGSYCDEFSYRFNSRGEQLAMFDGTLKDLVHGGVLPYKN